MVIFNHTREARPILTLGPSGHARHRCSCILCMPLYGILASCTLHPSLSQLFEKGSCHQTQNYLIFFLKMLSLKFSDVLCAFLWIKYGFIFIIKCIFIIQITAFCLHLHLTQWPSYNWNWGNSYINRCSSHWTDDDEVYHKAYSPW